MAFGKHSLGCIWVSRGLLLEVLARTSLFLQPAAL
jgi:hypothetical protein